MLHFIYQNRHNAYNSKFVTGTIVHDMQLRTPKRHFANTKHKIYENYDFS